MIRYTVDDIMREGPCSSYPLSRVRSLWGGSESLSPFDIALLPIPVEDRIWALLCLLFRLSPHRARRVARLIAIDVLDLWDPPDIVVLYLGTGDEQSRAAALDAARYARDVVEASEAVVSVVSAAESAWAAAMRNYPSWVVAAGAPAAGAAAAAAYAEGAGFSWVIAWHIAMRRYLSWVVKAFDPFAPVWGLS